MKTKRSLYFRPDWYSLIKPGDKDSTPPSDDSPSRFSLDNGDGR